MCRVSTKFAYFSCKYLFCAICFAHFLRNQLKTGSIAQNVHFYAKHWPKNWQKLTKIDSFSTQSNQLKVYSNLTKIDQNWQFQHTIKSTKGLFKNVVYTNKLWFCCYQFVTVGLQNLQIEVQKLIKQKLEIWKLKMDDSFYRCLNVSVVLNYF